MFEETPSQPTPAAPNKPKTGLLIGVAVVVILCCCCLVAGAGGYYYFSTQVEKTFSSINESLLTPVVPIPEDFPAVPEIPVLPTDEAGLPQIPESPYDTSQFIPQGGLGDEILRADTWVYVAAGAAAASCVAIDPTLVTIEVLEQPDAAGVWQEKWTVGCDGGGEKAFEVTFSPGAQGGTDISLKESK